VRSPLVWPVDVLRISLFLLFLVSRYSTEYRLAVKFHRELGIARKGEIRKNIDLGKESLVHQNCEVSGRFLG
jgi:hypothetical protein